MSDEREIGMYSSQYVDDSLIHVNMTLTYRQYVALCDMVTTEAANQTTAFAINLADTMDRHLQAIELQREARPGAIDVQAPMPVGVAAMMARCGECGFFYYRTGNCSNCGG